jgi:hypothetical protein
MSVAEVAAYSVEHSAGEYQLETSVFLPRNFKSCKNPGQ